MARTYYKGNLLQLNSVNGGVCPNASTIAPRRLCIAPLVGISSAAASSSSLQAVKQLTTGTTVQPIGRRRLAQQAQETNSSSCGFGAAGGVVAKGETVTCIESRWVQVGRSCEDLAVAYGLSISTFLSYNPGVRACKQLRYVLVLYAYLC